MTTTPTEEQMEEQINRAAESHNAYPGMTYEEGVDAALRWALGWSGEPPMEDE